MPETTVRTAKSKDFFVSACPKCGNRFKQARSSPVKLPEECPLCNQPQGDDVDANDTLVVNAKSLQRIAGETARNAAAIRTLQSDVKSILSVLGKSSTSLNDDASPENTATT